MTIYAKGIGLLLLGFLHLGLVLGQETKEIRKTVPLSPDGQVVIKTFKGSVNITTWDSPTVDIYARIEPDGTAAEDRAKVRDTEVEIDASAQSVRIHSDYRKVQDRVAGLFNLNFSSSGSLPLIQYTIKMPRRAKLEIKDHKSKIQVVGLHSDVAINTHKGTVDLAQLDGSLKLNTHKGDIRIGFSNLTAASQVETHKGDIEIAIPRGRGFDLDSNLGRRGRLDSDFDIGATTRHPSRHKKEYRGAVNGGGPLLRLRTFKGSFRLRQV